MNEGLPAGQVYDVAFTEDGYVWFGTAYGLVKSDGVSFETFGEEHGFNDEIVNDLFVDDEGNLLISTYYDGVSKFYQDSIIYPKEFSFLSGKDVSSIKQANSGEYWFGTTADGIYIRDLETGELDSLNTSNSEIPSNTVWDIFLDNNGEVWISTHSGVFIVDKSKNFIHAFTQENGLSDLIAYHVFKSKDGNYWVSTSNGITIIDGEDYSARQIYEVADQKLGYVYNINQDREGRIWIATERNGLFWYSEYEEVNIRKGNGLSSNFLYRLVRDDKGTIWIATDGDGVNILKDTRFKIYDGKSEYDSDEVYGVHKHSSGTLFFANDDGLTSYKNGEFKKFEFPKEYSGIEIWDIEELPNGNLLMLSYEYSLFEFDGQKISEYSLRGGKRPYYKTDVLINDKDEIVLAGEYGIQMYTASGVDSVKIEDEYWASYVNIVHQDSDGIYWLGTERGIVELNNGTLKRYDEDEGVTGEGVYEIKEDELGNIWFGTNKGITIFAKTSDSENPYRINSYTLGDEFLSETMFLQFDKTGGVWQGTNAGLNYVNLHSWDEDGSADIIHYSLKEYGKGIEFNGSASLEDDEGNLWFGTARNGVVKFTFPDSARTVQPDEAPIPFLKSIQADIDHEYSDSGLIEFEYENNSIEFAVGAFKYKDPERVSFRYKLEGFDDQLSEATNDRSKRYTNLPPGEYTFQVYAKSHTSKWSEVPASVTIKINAPFWYKWWFWLLIVILIFVIGYVVLKTRLEVLEKEKLSVLVKERTQDLEAALNEKEILIKEIHHRVKNNLAVISGLLEMQSWGLDSEEAKSALNDSKLRIATIANIHENLYQNKDLGNIDFEKFLVQLKRGILNTLNNGQTDIKIQVNVKTGLLGVHIAIPCGLIINELMTNSFKHAFNGRSEGKIHIEFLEEKDQYLLSVRDNGVGIEEDIIESNRSSLGITLVQSLASQLSAQVEVENQNGARFTFKIPKK